MAFRMSNDLKNVLCNSGVVNQLAGTDGTDGTASLNIYNGTQPASGDDGTAGTLLCTISNIGWTAATAGTASFANTAGYTGTASATGTAGWGRMETVNENGTCRVDGDIGTSGANVFTINNASLTEGGVVTLLSADIYMA